MTRLYARASGGSRIYEGTPDSRWKMLTILGALSTRGIVAAMTIEEATNGDIFLAYLDHFLCPQLRAGDVVVMDIRINATSRSGFLHRGSLRMEDRVLGTRASDP